MFSKDPAYYSHKSNHAGLNYEIAVSLTQSRIVWVSGPHPAGTGDLEVFRNGLKALIPEGSRVIADKGYRGEQCISTPNDLDEAHIRRYKSRARARHETVNGRIKNFKAVSQRFHHSRAVHGPVFEAVCVVVQYQFDTGVELFQIV